MICFFGDGASNEGAFHESINMASVWKLPVIYLCENNQYGMSNSVGNAMSARQMIDRAPGYGIPGKQVDGMDVLAVYEAVSEAAEYVPGGQRPDPDRRPDLSLSGALEERPAALSHEGRGRGLEAARRDRRVRALPARGGHRHAGRTRRTQGEGRCSDRRSDRLRRRRPRAAGGAPDPRRVRRGPGRAGPAGAACLPKWASATFGTATRINPARGRPRDHLLRGAARGDGPGAGL